MFSVPNLVSRVTLLTRLMCTSFSVLIKTLFPRVHYLELLIRGNYHPKEFHISITVIVIK